MEVHHHPTVEKKNFKEYLLEGLMIFLAVTMGFFAESLREHINDHTRAKEFAISMCTDLKEDSVSLVPYTKRVHYAATNLDTLFNLLSTNEAAQIATGKLYWYGLFGGLLLTFSPHDATLLEMKSTGTLRYFSNPYINRMVAGYDQMLQKIKFTDEQQQGIYTEVRTTRAELFDFKYNEAANTVLRRMYKKYDQQAIDSFISTNPPLISVNKVVFNKYIELARSRFLHSKAAEADTLLIHAGILMKALRKEYDLKD